MIIFHFKNQINFSGIFIKQTKKYLCAKKLNICLFFYKNKSKSIQGQLITFNEKLN